MTATIPTVIPSIAVKSGHRHIIMIHPLIPAIKNNIDATNPILLCALSLIIYLHEIKKYLVPWAGVEPARSLVPRDSESLAYTSFATEASGGEIGIRTPDRM
jgi:hypothetical protein